MTASSARVEDQPHRQAIWTAVRAIDLLESLPPVDAERLGCVADSTQQQLGLFLHVMDQRLTAAVASIASVPDSYTASVEPEAALTNLLAATYPRPLLLGITPSAEPATASRFQAAAERARPVFALSEDGANDPVIWESDTWDAASATDWLAARLRHNTASRQPD